MGVLNHEVRRAVVGLAVAFLCICGPVRAGEAGHELDALASETLSSALDLSWRVGDWWLVGHSKSAMPGGEDEWLPPDICYYEVVAECELDGIPCVVVEKWPEADNEPVAQTHTVYYLRARDKAVLREVACHSLRGRWQAPRRIDYPAIVGIPSCASIALPSFPLEPTAPLPSAAETVRDGRGALWNQQVETVALAPVRESLGSLGSEKSTLAAASGLTGFQVEMTADRGPCVLQVWAPGAPWFLYAEERVENKAYSRSWLITFGGADVPALPSEELDLSPLSARSQTTPAGEISLAAEEDIVELPNNTPQCFFRCPRKAPRNPVPQYKVYVPAGASQLEIRTWGEKGAVGDSHMYVRHGAPTTAITADHRPYQRGNEETFTEIDPPAGYTYFILVADTPYCNVWVEVRYSEPLVVNGPAVGGHLLDPNTVDWWKLVVTWEDEYTIETRAGTLVDNVMELYPSTRRNRIARAEGSGTGDLARIVASLAPGTYYLKVETTSASRGTYTIRVTSRKPPEGPAVVSFALDRGAATTGRDIVTLDNTCTGSPEQYMASESPIFAGATWERYETSPLFKLSKGEGTKTVYFKVADAKGRESAVVSDAIMVSLKPDAVLVTVDGPAVRGEIFVPGEEDWYQFTVPWSGWYTVETILGSLNDTYMYLYGPDDQDRLLAENDDSIGLASGLRLWLSAGTYYVKVRAFSAAATGTYSVQVTGG